MLSEPYLLSILIHNGGKKKVYQNLGGGGLHLLRALWIRHCQTDRYAHALGCTAVDHSCMLSWLSIVSGHDNAQSVARALRMGDAKLPDLASGSGQRE